MLAPLGYPGSSWLFLAPPYNKWTAGGGQEEPGGLKGRKWSAGEGQEELGGIEGHEALKPKMKLKI